MSLNETEEKMHRFVDGLVEFQEVVQKRQSDWLALIEENLPLLDEDDRRYLEPALRELEGELLLLSRLVPDIADVVSHRLSILRRYLNEE
ncbi:hypothetical protein AB733_15440 [Photobacterium swingsii]|uniref:Flagellar protein FliT n=1 Tax=Photobacterium swingsii TaxID=680026 RepID=A0A0J8XWY8_9GAMM|nr:hypothetical protein [Photobacterium swingsii]KMV29884.1 hypothetical protein AB733_15440 [Photobacterium swingsii]PSW26028.1 hypothetical protein C9I94_05620 [Photobacterium swingsii]